MTKVTYISSLASSAAALGCLYSFLALGIKNFATNNAIHINPRSFSRYLNPVANFWMFAGMTNRTQNHNITWGRSQFWMGGMRTNVMSLKLFCGTTLFTLSNILYSGFNYLSNRMRSERNASFPIIVLFSRNLCSMREISAFARTIFRVCSIPPLGLKGFLASLAYKIINYFERPIFSTLAGTWSRTEWVFSFQLRWPSIKSRMTHWAQELNFGYPSWCSSYVHEITLPIGAQ